MKHIYLFTFLLISLFGFAQEPAGYYNSATGTGFELKSQLKAIINNSNDGLDTEYLHNSQDYSAMDAFIAENDLDVYDSYENDNSILDVYSENPSGTDPYNFTPITNECGNYSSEGDCYNKEHVIPKSVFNDAMPMYSDGHNLLPTDGRVNGFRSNYPFGVVDDNQLVSQSGISNPTQNGSKLGGNLNSGVSAGYTGTVFEPIDEFKGDIARIYFYFATRYEDQIDAWGAFDMFDGSNNNVFAEPFLAILLNWHNNDPVSQKEIDRNNALFTYQNNRNPFIDHPEFVAQIWSTTTDTEAPTAPSNLAASNPTDNSVDLNWNASTDNVAVTVYDIYIDGVYAFSNATTSTTATSLSPNTTYCFTVKAKDAAGNESVGSNEVCETTTNNGSSGGEDLFFSEYIEGGGNNKALEIANFTGVSINDLSMYTLKLSSNGNSGWTATYSFPASAQITQGDVYVIANGSATICSSEYDDLNNTITGFNGNDAIGLFKNDVLIDIIGTLGDDSTFAQNTTLVRKSTVSGPSTTFDLNEWDSYAQDTCDDLGSHTQTLGTTEFTSNTIKIYPNPVSGNTLNIDTNKTFDYSIYNILGKQVLKGISKTGTIMVQNLPQGIYILKLDIEGQSVTKKLVKK